MPLSIGGNVKVQDSVFTAGSSGNWNVSFFSIALQLSSVLSPPLGTESDMNLTVKSSFFSALIDGDAVLSFFFLWYF